jgi:hypothetical protein
MGSGNDVRRPRGLAALASVTAAVAVVTVLVTAAVAAQRYAARPGASTPSPTATGPSIEYPSVTAITPSVFDDGQIVYGDTSRNAYFEAPSASAGWTYEEGTIIGVESPPDYTGPAPVVRAPVSLDLGWCAPDPSAQRAYVGFGVSVVSQDAQAANATIVGSWHRGLGWAKRQRDRATPVVGPQRSVTLGDGGTAWLTTLTSRWHTAEKPCGVDRVSVSVLSRDTGDQIASVVGYRRLGTGADLSLADLTEILETVRPQTTG